MFGKNAWVDKLRERLTAYVDERFEDYRERLADDLSRGLATLAGILTIWTVAVLCLVFLGIVVALLTAVLLKGWLGNWSYLLGFLVVMVIYAGLGAWFIRYREQYVEDPVFEAMHKSLRGEEEQAKKVVEEKKPIAAVKTPNPEKEKNETVEKKTPNDSTDQNQK